MPRTTALYEGEQNGMLNYQILQALEKEKHMIKVDDMTSELDDEFHTGIKNVMDKTQEIKN